MKKLILIIAALMLMSCTSGETSSKQDRKYNDNVIVYNANGEVLKAYDNVKVITGANAEKVYIDTSDGQRFLIVGGTVVVKFGDKYE